MHTASSYLPVHVVRPALRLFDGSFFSLPNIIITTTITIVITVTTTITTATIITFLPPSASSTSGYQRRLAVEQFSHT